MCWMNNRKSREICAILLNHQDSFALQILIIGLPALERRLPVPQQPDQ